MVAIPALVRREGKRMTMVLSQGVTVVGLLGLCFGYGNMALVFVFGSLVNAGFGMARSSVWGMIPDTVEFGEWRSGERSEGVTYAAFIGVEKLGTAFSGIISGVALSIAGFVANAAQSPSAAFGILSLTTLLPALASLAVIAVVWGYRLDGQGFDRILSELKEKRRS